MEKPKEQGVLIKQEPWIEVLIRSIHNPNVWKNLLFSNIIQLLPIWVMLLIQYVSEYYFKIEEYISNLLVFVIIACVTNLSELFSENNSKLKEISTAFAIFLLIFILCFATILYCLLLLNQLTNLSIKNDILGNFSICFTLIIVLISIWQVARREK